MGDGDAVQYVVRPNRRIFVVALVMAGVALVAGSIGGQWLVGVLFGVGLLLGAVHATMSANALRRFLDRGDVDNRRGFAYSSLLRLFYVTAAAAVLLMAFHRAAIAALVGLVVFHFLVLVSRTGPLLRELRKG